MFAVSLIFWNIYNQNSTALTIWAEKYTNREAPKAVQPALKPFGFLQTVNTNIKDEPILDEQFREQADAKGNILTKPGVDPIFSKSS